MSEQSRYKKYNDKRVQLLQIKCEKGSKEHKDILTAINKLKKEKGWKSTRAAVIGSLLEAAKNIKKVKKC